MGRRGYGWGKARLGKGELVAQGGGGGAEHAVGEEEHVGVLPLLVVQSRQAARQRRVDVRPRAVPHRAARRRVSRRRGCVGARGTREAGPEGVAEEAEEGLEALAGLDADFELRELPSPL
jgi:hypothetical protein